MWNCSVARQCMSTYCLADTSHAALVHWDIFEHPLYSLDLPSLNFSLFPKMKEHLAGKRFTNDEDLKEAVITWLNTRRPHDMKWIYTNSAKVQEVP